jgi:hypothetical protein
LTLPIALALLGCGGEVRSLGDGRGDGPLLPSDAAVPPASDATVQPAGDATAGERFAEPEPIAALADDPSASDDDPSLTQDLRELYFNSKRDGGQGREDVWFTKRAAPDAAWSAPRPATELNSEHRETGIALSADGLTVWFSSDRPGGKGGLDVYSASRASRSAAFAEVKRIDELSSDGDDLVSAVDVASETLYLARRDDEDDDYDLYLARRAAPGQPWGQREAIASLNSDREESDAFAVNGGAQLMFTRSADLLLAERSADGQHAVRRVLDELNSDDEERDAWATEDLRYVVFSSDRSGTYLLYEARLRQ